MDEDQKRLAEELLFSEKKKPSFVKRLFFGEFLPDNILPYPSVPPKESIDYVSKVKKFALDKVDPVTIDKESSIPDSVVNGLRELGVLGLIAPKELGGQGMNFTTYCKLTESLAAHCASTTLFINVHMSIGLKALMLFGTPKQKEHWIPKLASGEIIAAFALTEPNAGSDAAGIETYADYNPQKKTYTINGQKRWITNGGIAGLLTVMAKTKVQTKRGIEEKITAFLVTPDTPGFKVLNKALDKVGFKGTKTALLAFENMEVPEENILGPVGGGLKVALTVLDYGRTTFGALCTGIAKYLVERAVAHVRERRQFNRQIGSFSLVKKKIAEISALAYAMEATTYLTAGLIDQDIEDVMLETAILKVFASESLWSIIYDVMQLFGGRSLFTDEPFERIMRDARLNMIGEGSNEVLRAFISVVGMRDVGMELKGVVDELKNPFEGITSFTSFIKNSVNRFMTPEIPVKSSELQEQAAAVGKLTGKLKTQVFKTLAKYGEGVVEKQLDLNRLTTVAIALYTSTAVLGKLDRDLQNNSAGKNDVEKGIFYCRSAIKGAYAALDELFSNEDGEVESLSDNITGIKGA